MDENIKKIIKDHAEWLNDNEEGARANLSSADLRWANLSEADLTFGGEYV